MKPTATRVAWDIIDTIGEQFSGRMTDREFQALHTAIRKRLERHETELLARKNGDTKQ